VTTSLDIGGGEQHIAQMAPLLLARGLAVSIGCISHAGLLAPALRDQGIRVIGPEVYRGERGFAGMMPGTARLIAEMLDQRPAIVHFFKPSAYLVGAPSAAIARVPIRIMSRRVGNAYQRQHPFQARLERRLNRRADFILANSRQVLEQLTAEEGVPAEKVGLIHTPVDFSRFAGAFDRQGARDRLAIPRNALVMINVAALAGHKGHADVFNALARIKAELPEPWMLLLAGADVGERTALQAQANRLAIGRNVRFLGVRKDVPDLLRLADLAVLAPHNDGYSSSVLEAAAAGLASVVTDVGSNRELVVDGVTGLIVPAKSPASLADAIARLIGQRNLRRQMGQAARQRAFEDFGLAGCADKYAALYEALLSGRPAGSGLGSNADAGAPERATPEREVH